MIKILLVKTWSETKKEGENYLKYNNYGVVKNVLNSDYYLCISNNNYEKLNDVKIVCEV